MSVDYPLIYTKFQEACQILELKKLPILKFGEGYYACQYIEQNNEIIINLNNINEAKIRLLPFIKITLSNDIDIIMFNIYHELGHCFHFQKFSKWTNKFITQWQWFERNNEIIERDKRYRELKVEKCADKIAYILFEKLEKEVKNNAI